MTSTILLKPLEMRRREDFSWGPPAGGSGWATLGPWWTVSTAGGRGAGRRDQWRVAAGGLPACEGVQKGARGCERPPKVPDRLPRLHGCRRHRGAVSTGGALRRCPGGSAPVAGSASPIEPWEIATRQMPCRCRYCLPRCPCRCCSSRRKKARERERERERRRNVRCPASGRLTGCGNVPRCVSSPPPRKMLRNNHRARWAGASHTTQGWRLTVQALAQVPPRRPQPVRPAASFWSSIAGPSARGMRSGAFYSLRFCRLWGGLLDISLLRRRRQPVSRLIPLLSLP